MEMPRGFGLPASIIANAVEKTEKFDDNTVVVKKVLYGEDNSEVVITQQTYTKDAIETEMALLDKAIANYKDPKWIATKVADLMAKKSANQMKLDLLQ